MVMIIGDQLRNRVFRRRTSILTFEWNSSMILVNRHISIRDLFQGFKVVFNFRGVSSKGYEIDLGGCDSGRGLADMTTMRMLNTDKEQTRSRQRTNVTRSIHVNERHQLAILAQLRGRHHNTKNYGMSWEKTVSASAMKIVGKHLRRDISDRQLTDKHAGAFKTRCVADYYFTPNINVLRCFSRGYS
jgi:hypothetical protein